MKKQIKIAAKLYECRDTARRFFKDEYTEKIEPYKSLIKIVMKANNIDELQAILKISQTETYQENSMSQMLFMAAAVDLIEMRNPKEKRKYTEEEIRKQADEFCAKWLPKWEKYCEVCKALNCKSNDTCIKCGCQF